MAVRGTQHPGQQGKNPKPNRPSRDTARFRPLKISKCLSRKRRLASPPPLRRSLSSRNVNNSENPVRGLVVASGPAQQAQQTAGARRDGAAGGSGADPRGPGGPEASKFKGPFEFLQRSRLQSAPGHAVALTLDALRPAPPRPSRVSRRQQELSALPRPAGRVSASPRRRLGGVGSRAWYQTPTRRALTFETYFYILEACILFSNR